ncbi:MAG: SCO family protein [Burkholderiales bacterium]
MRTAQSTHRELWKESDHEPPVMLVNFIYTTCPTVCSALGSEFTQMQAVISKQRPSSRSPIELVSISFDTEHDDAAQLAAYARVHHADSDVWTIAAPTSQEDSARLLRELGVVVVRDGIGGYVHNGSIHVMTATGRVKAIYDAADWQAALAMATRLATAAP